MQSRCVKIGAIDFEMRDVFFKTVQTGHERWDVFYSLRADGSAYGVVHVDSNGIEQDVETVVELAAIRFLLCEKEITGSNVYGSSFNLHVSTPSIARAADSTSIKAHLSAPSHFLATRFKGAVISHSIDFEWMSSWNYPKFREFDFRAMDHSEELVNCPLLKADVIISRHALKRQVTRFDAASEIEQSGRGIDTIDIRFWTAAWRALITRLKSPGLKKINLEERYRRSLVFEYGSDSIVLSHESHKQVFVLVPHIKGRFVLVTVFPFSKLSKYAGRVPTHVGQNLF
jgi:hypothetical protein